MGDVIQFITSGQAEFTPDVIVGLIVFCMLFDSLCMCLASFAKVGKN